MTTMAVTTLSIFTAAFVFFAASAVTVGASMLKGLDRRGNIADDASNEHSCYYYVVHENRCNPSGSPAGAEMCIECADKNKSTLEKLGCTDELIWQACHGVLPPTPPSPPAPGDMVLKLHPQDSGALCLDGSPAGYYWRPGSGENASKFLLIFNGGGWCMGNDATSSALACAERATTSLGTSKLWKPNLSPDPHGVTNPNCTVNPAFCTWSIAYMYYCDGVSFSGNLEEPIRVPNGKVSPIFFRGKRIMEENIQDLIVTHSLDKATTVVLSGHSAGGLATYLHADQVRKMLPESLPNYKAVPDAGFFLDHANTSGVKSYGQKMRAVFKLANASWAFNKPCVQSSADIYDCVFPQNFASKIMADIHVIQSQYDSYQLSAILELGCVPPKGDCSSSQLNEFLQYGADMRVALHSSGLYNGNKNRAIWNDACIAHSQAYYGDYMDNTEWEVPSGSGVTLAASLHGWITGANLGPMAVHVDRFPWPNNKPCSNFSFDISSEF